MILVLGQGLLGKTLVTFYPDLIGISHQECDIRSAESISYLFFKYKPDYIINCAGIVPKANVDPLEMFQTNAVGPRLLSQACVKHNCRLIHISTDCVFSGKTGRYKETDTPDPISLYGMSKYLGEVLDYNHVTFRCSFVGYPDPLGHGLLSWFKRQEEPVGGYISYRWNGLTTVELAHFIMTHLDWRSGLWHVANKNPITKYDLLYAANEIYGWNKDIYPDGSVSLSRTLRSDFDIDKSYYRLLTEMKDTYESLS